MTEEWITPSQKTFFFFFNVSESQKVWVANTRTSQSPLLEVGNEIAKNISW